MTRLQGLRVGDQVDLSGVETEPTEDHNGDHAECLALMAAGPSTIAAFEPAEPEGLWVSFTNGVVLHFMPDDQVPLVSRGS